MHVASCRHNVGSLCCRNVAPRKAARPNGPAPRLSTINLDEHAADRVRKARESVFNASVDLADLDAAESREPPELDDQETSPLPPELVKASAGRRKGKRKGKSRTVTRPVSKVVSVLMYCVLHV